MSDSVIQTRGLTRYYGNKCALDGVTLDVPRGSVTALLGRNGSGKTTLIRIAVGLLEPTRGSATILGQECRAIPPAVRGRIGYIAENHPLIDWMTIGTISRYERSFHAKWNEKLFRTITGYFRMNERAKVGSLSRGERAGLSLALALASEPELLVMDDPALGLDPVARRTLLESMVFLTRDTSRTILFSSHLLADVERVADRVAILDRSVLRASCSVETFRSRVKQLILRFAAGPPPLPRVDGLLQARREENAWRLTIANLDDPAQLSRQFGAISVEEAPVTLEDAVIGYLADAPQTIGLLSEAEVMS